jgi:hypothetical protein
LARRLVSLTAVAFLALAAQASAVVVEGPPNPWKVRQHRPVTFTWRFEIPPESSQSQATILFSQDSRPGPLHWQVSDLPHARAKPGMTAGTLIPQDLKLAPGTWYYRFCVSTPVQNGDGTTFNPPCKLDEAASIRRLVVLRHRLPQMTETQAKTYARRAQARTFVDYPDNVFDRRLNCSTVISRPERRCSFSFVSQRHPTERVYGTIDVFYIRHADGSLGWHYTLQYGVKSL